MADPITPESRARLVRLGAESAELAAESLNGLLLLRRELEARGPVAESAALNGAEFFLLLQHDLSSLIAGLAMHTRTLRGNLYARLILLTVHESTHTMQSVLARSFRDQLVAAVGRPDANATLRQVHSDATELHRRSEREFGEVRDGIVAHVDRDAEVRARLLAEADEERISQLATDLLGILHRLGPLITEYYRVLRSRLPEASA